jgi:hypothetical protein
VLCGPLRVDPGQPGIEPCCALRPRQAIPARESAAEGAPAALSLFALSLKGISLRVIAWRYARAFFCRWNRNRPVRPWLQKTVRARNRKSLRSLLLPAEPHNCFVRLALSRAMQPMPDWVS